MNSEISNEQIDKISIQISQMLMEKKGLKTIIPQGTKGGFGLVLFVQDINTQIKYAIKAQSIIDSVNGGIDDDKHKMCLAEAQILKNLNHKNIVEYHSDFLIGFYHFIQMNLCECSLDDWIQQRGQQPLSHDIFFYFLNQIVDGIEHLHSHNYVLRDLSTKNILISYNGTIKLCDFGLAKKIDTQIVSHVKSINAQGVYVYFPPELIQEFENGSKTFTQSKSGDIWALGICLSLLGGLKFIEVAYFNQPNSQIKQSPLLDDFCNTIIQFILKKDPKQRPSIAQLRKYMYDKFIQNSDIQQIDQSKKQNLQIQLDLDTYYNTREIDIEITKYKETEKECLQNQNKIESLIKLGYINLYYNNNMDGAVQYFIDALLLNNNDPDIYLGLAQVQIEKCNYEKKKSDKIDYYIEKADQISPNYWRVSYLRVQQYFYKNDYEGAKKYLENCIKINNHPLLKQRYYFLSSLLSNDLTKKKQFLQEFEKENFPVKYRQYYYYLAWMANYSNDTDKSIKYYLEELKYLPNNPKTLFCLGSIYEVQKKYTDAEKYYRMSVKLNPLYQDAQNKLTNLINKQKSTQ